MKNVKNIITATVEGAISSIPVAGSFIDKYIGLAKDGVAEKTMNEWKNLVDDRLSKLELDLGELANDELFFSCIQTTTVAAMRAFQKEKREFLANALYNTQTISDISNEKKVIIIGIIDRYSVIAIKTLDLFSNKRMHERRNGHIVGHIFKHIPEYEKDKSFATSIMKMLLSDGLIEADQFNLMNVESLQKTRVTTLGGELLKFISYNESEYQ